MERLGERLCSGRADSLYLRPIAGLSASDRRQSAKPVQECLGADARDSWDRCEGGLSSRRTRGALRPLGIRRSIAGLHLGARWCESKEPKGRVPAVDGSHDPNGFAFDERPVTNLVVSGQQESSLDGHTKLAERPRYGIQWLWRVHDDVHGHDSSTADDQPQLQSKHAPIPRQLALSRSESA
jgi:hypothetical protein